MEATNEKDEAIVRKIRALFDKAKSAGEIGSDKEAEIFAAKAQDMLNKYNLTREDLTDEVKAKGMVIPYERWFKKTESTWVSSLLHTLAKYNFCMSIADDSRNAWVIIGEENNANTVAQLGEMLIPEVRSLCNESCRLNWNGNPNTYKRGYFRGFVHGLGEKLREEQEEQLRKAKAIEAGDTNLPAYYGKLPSVIAQNKLLVTNFVEKHYPKLRNSRSASLSGVSGYQKGREQGKQTNLNRGSRSYGGGQRRLK